MALSAAPSDKAIWWRVRQKMARWLGEAAAFGYGVLLVESKHRSRRVRLNSLVAWAWRCHRVSQYCILERRPLAATDF